MSLYTLSVGVETITWPTGASVKIANPFAFHPQFSKLPQHESISKRAVHVDVVFCELLFLIL